VYPISKRELEGGGRGEVVFTRGEFTDGAGRGPVILGPEAMRWPDGRVLGGMGRMPWGPAAAESGRGRAD
jgi:hypothetical protein